MSNLIAMLIWLSEHKITQVVMFVCWVIMGVYGAVATVIHYGDQDWPRMAVAIGLVIASIYQVRQRLIK